MTILSLIPIAGLLVCLIFLKLSVVKSGLISLCLTLTIALVFFGLNGFGLAVAIGKALALSLFVSLIVWSALLLYHLISDFKAIDVLSKNIVIFINDKFIQFLFLSWLFSGVLQGIAGFGVPIVIIAPILITLGFDKIKSLAAVLIGHSWAVTFGSMGTAFFVISMITGITPEELGISMWIFNTIAHVLTGLGVCYVYDRYNGIKRGILYVLPVSVLMAATQYGLVYFEVFPIAGLFTAVIGVIALFVIYRLTLKQKTVTELYRCDLDLFQSVLPFIVILILALTFQFIPDALKNISLSFRFPNTSTALYYMVHAEDNYAAIKLFGHPATKLICASIVAVLIFIKAGIWNKDTFKLSLKKTIDKGVPATIALITLSTMSLIMADSGMTNRLAFDVANLTGRFYPVIAPFFGVLSSFLTGNNTNANVLLGAFQFTIAQQLGVNTAVMSAVQSLSASVGVSIGPTLVLMGVIATKQTGYESTIYKRLIGIVLLIALVMGIVNYVLLLK